jgi:hypothetical protein
MFSSILNPARRGGSNALRFLQAVLPSGRFSELQNMKRKMMTLAGLACAGALALSWDNLHAQSDSTVPATPAPAAQATSPTQNSPATPGVPGQSNPPGAPRQIGPPPRPGGRPGLIYQRTLYSLQQTKVELQQATNDFDGHRTLALDACDKAITELQAVMKSAGIQPIQARRPPPRPQPQPAPQTPAAPAPTAPVTPAAPSQQ